ncbi:carbon-nitrogen hydrolase family protein [Marinicella rhabdoformis]|uniref:carbon-nitrogen hydrolase family protein n=1 Tax=Marinicella rhabdoformis TaxID=2580566 RepID=UPI0012AEB4C4|nr:carbon-nitrogen hydrolase family protein [Marinicella rhabdoformis]
MSKSNQLIVGLAQMAPVWLNREASIDKMLSMMDEGKSQGCELLVFGEGVLPGYPFWIELTQGARFNAQDQKELHAHYCQQAVQIERGDLDSICQRAKQHKMALYLGIIERPVDRGGHSLYCSIVYVNEQGVVKSVHRKLMPTFEERLTWSIGDGHGLQTHKLGPFTVGGLNCWENWMPLARTALYAQGEDLHVANWPGSIRNTHDITPMMAKEGRSFVMSVGGLMRPEDFPKDTPHYDAIIKGCVGIDFLTDGGSCLCAPDGSFVIEPQVNVEGVFSATIDHNKVYEERQNFDPVGHYSRPDVFEFKVNKDRQGFGE